MFSELAERVLKASQRVLDLRQERNRLTAEIDAKIREAENELQGLLGGSGSSPAVMNAETIQERTVRILREKPRLAYNLLTAQVYGADTPRNRHKLRATVWTLVRKGKIRAVNSPTNLEVVDGE